MARFLICSFALVLLYPSGIDMYLVGLPRIAQDLGASEAQLHIAFSVPSARLLPPKMRRSCTSCSPT